MWPTSMPRHRSSLHPCHPGLGIAATTLRMSATRSGSGRSRPKLTPVRWKLGLVGATDEIAHRGDVRSAMTGFGRGRPDRADKARAIAAEGADFASVAKRKAAQRGNLAGLDFVQVVVAANSSKAKVLSSSSLTTAISLTILQRDDRSSAATSSQAVCPAWRSSRMACQVPDARRRARSASAISTLAA
jgi:hypothetical protein